MKQEDINLAPRYMDNKHKNIKPEKNLTNSQSAKGNSI